jgi:hypothetical protein
MDSFDTSDPVKAREIAMQFMGQQLGEIKDLNTRLIESTTTLRPIDPKFRAVVDSIPLPPQGAPPPIPVQYVQNVQAAPQVGPPHPEFRTQPKNDNQLELNFTYDIVQDLVDRVTRIEVMCKKILEQVESQHTLSVPLKKS